MPPSSGNEDGGKRSRNKDNKGGIKPKRPNTTPDIDFTKLAPLFGEDNAIQEDKLIGFMK